jgi:hypothetical protein
MELCLLIEKYVLIGHLAMALSRTEMLGRGTPLTHLPFIVVVLYLSYFRIDPDIWMIHVGATVD